MDSNEENKSSDDIIQELLSSFTVKEHTATPCLDDGENNKGKAPLHSKDEPQTSGKPPRRSGGITIACLKDSVVLQEVQRSAQCSQQQLPAAACSSTDVQDSALASKAAAEPLVSQSNKSVENDKNHKKHHHKKSKESKCEDNSLARPNDEADDDVVITSVQPSRKRSASPSSSSHRHKKSRRSASHSKNQTLQSSKSIDECKSSSPKSLDQRKSRSSKSPSVHKSRSSRSPTSQKSGSRKSRSRRSTSRHKKSRSSRSSSRHKKSRSSRSRSRHKKSRSSRSSSRHKKSRSSRSRSRHKKSRSSRSSSRHKKSRSSRSTSRHKKSRSSRSTSRHKKSRSSRSSSRHKKSRSNRSPSRRKRSRSRKPGDHHKSSIKKEKCDDEDCVKILKDKVTRKRLLEIARRNALQLVSSGVIPSSLGPVPPVGPGSAPASQPRSIHDLTAFCKQLAESGNYSDDGDNGLVGSDDDESEEEDKSEAPFTYSGRHPFALKDKPITMNIRNAPMLPVKSNAERLQESSKLREQFPVSSGTHHKQKDDGGWTPVEAASSSSQATPSDNTESAKDPKDQVFPTVDEDIANLNLSEMVSERLRAMRNLQENPNDANAKKKLDALQETMSKWALSKQEPGKFTGTTGVKVLSQQELSSGQQAWAKKEQLITAKPVSSAFGMRMLQKMGWNPGEGLGKNKEGSTTPLLLEVKTDKKGFHAQEELTPVKPSIPMTKTVAGGGSGGATPNSCSLDTFSQLTKLLLDLRNSAAAAPATSNPLQLAALLNLLALSSKLNQNTSPHVNQTPVPLMNLNLTPHVNQNVTSLLNQNFTSRVSQNTTSRWTQNTASLANQNTTSHLNQNFTSRVNQNATSHGNQNAMSYGNQNAMSYGNQNAMSYGNQNAVSYGHQNFTSTVSRNIASNASTPSQSFPNSASNPNGNLHNFKWCMILDQIIRRATS
ncbi:protein SON isoform X3 [Hyalella azteca]|uniref:Protein SON isoform X3 n=1 Tax=Hyalella azteca TaxID=294128 RepID=A0A979FP39_HYAAZ|nr:protein SON isoform X3 [Hyalella azteca]